MPPANPWPPHYYYQYLKSGKSFKIFPILYVDSGDGPVAIMDPKDPAKYLNLFVLPRHEVVLLKRVVTYFLNGRNERIIPLDSELED